MSAELHPLDGEAPALESMTIDELVAELSRLQDRMHGDAASIGYRPHAGYMHRRAELERRERRIMRELERRYAAAPPAEGA